MKKTFLLLTVFFYAATLFGQQFEEPKLKTSDTLKVKVGADFAIQYQSL